MKKFITTLTLQPNASSSLELPYEYDPSCGFYYDRAIRNPIIPFIRQNTIAGEEIGVYLIVEDKSVNTEAGQTHLENFKSELDMIRAQNEFVCGEVKQIVLHAPQNSAEYMRLVKALIDVVEDGDTIYADMTYGRKAVPIAQFIALNYVYKIRQDVEIGTLSYGEAHNPGPDGKAKPTVFDLSGFFLLNDAIGNIAGDEQAGEHLESAIVNLIKLMERM